jgi:hypothetical protein
MGLWKILLLGLVSLVALDACASTKRISLPSAQADAGEVAIVKADWEMLGRKLSIEKLDGAQVRESSWKMPFVTEAEMTQGVHTMEVSFAEGRSRSTSNAVVRFDAQPGHTYQIHAAEIPESFWSEVGKAFVGGRGSWTAWVVDASTGQVAGGRKPPDAK